MRKNGCNNGLNTLLLPPPHKLKVRNNDRSWLIWSSVRRFSRDKSSIAPTFVARIFRRARVEFCIRITGQRQRTAFPIVININTPWIHFTSDLGTWWHRLLCTLSIQILMVNTAVYRAAKCRGVLHPSLRRVLIICYTCRRGKQGRSHGQYDT